MSTIREKYPQLKQEIKDYAIKVDRDPDTITLVAVSKSHPIETIEQAYEAGCRDFGENIVQEAMPKISLMPEDVRWHMIGTLQRKKVSGIIGKFVMIHSVDSLRLAEAISRHGEGHNSKILLQVNTSGEATKHGFTPPEIKGAFGTLKSLPNLNIQGLMTMAPYTEDEDVIRNAFKKLRLLKEELEEEEDHPLPFLSMGMSNDWKIAVEEGATHLRIGSEIFANL